MHNSDPWHYYAQARFCPKQTHYYDNAIYPYVNIQDLAKSLLTSIPHIIPVVSNPPPLLFIWNMGSWNIWGSPYSGLRICFDLVWFMVLNAIFNYIWDISWWPVVLLGETGVPRENHRHVASHWHIMFIENTSQWTGFELTTFSGDRHIGFERILEDYTVSVLL